VNVLYNALLIALALGLLFAAKSVAPRVQRAWRRRRSEARTARFFGTPLDPKTLAARPELLRRVSEQVGKVGVIENVGFAPGSAQGCATDSPATVTAFREYAIFVVTPSGDVFDVRTVDTRDEAVLQATALATLLEVPLEQGPGTSRGSSAATSSGTP
jgi:hypothetical protein